MNTYAASIMGVMYKPPRTESVHTAILIGAEDKAAAYSIALAIANQLHPAELGWQVNVVLADHEGMITDLRNVTVTPRESQLEKV